MKKILLLAVLIITSYSLSAQVVNPTRVNFDCTGLSAPFELVSTKLYSGSFLEREWTNPYTFPAGQVAGAVHIYYGDISYNYQLSITYKYKGGQRSAYVEVPRKNVNGNWRQPWDVNLKFTESAYGVGLATSYTYPNF